MSHILLRIGAALFIVGVFPIFVTPSALPAAGTVSEEDEECLDCHTDPELVKTLESGKSLPLFIDGEEYAASPHSALGCGTCHGEVSADTHPEERPIFDRKGYAARQSRICRSCHGEKQVREKSIHGYLLTQASAPPCSSCHAPHRVKSVREWKIKVPTSLYCLTCHQQELSVSLEGGETFTLTISEALGGASAHLSHECTDCHAGYSKQEHAVRDIKSKREHSLAAYATCRECHSEKYDLFEGSIHFKLANYGHPDAPLCADCHGHHSVKPKERFEMLAGTPCRKCHEEIFAAYRSSRHGQTVSAKGHLDAPLCSGCHRAHDVTYASMEEQVKDSCLGCHEDAMNDHRKWLPKVGTHFDAVTCTACHAPAVGRRVRVNVYDTASQAAVPLSTVRQMTGEEFDWQGRDAETGYQDLAFWGEVVWELNRKAGGGEARYLMRIDAPNDALVHELGGLEDACRQCDSCHRECLEYFEKSFFIFRQRSSEDEPSDDRK